MRKIKEYVEEIDEELESAKEYAETYLSYKALGNSAWANRYKEMATEELKHANYIHDICMSDIEELKKVYTPPLDMQEKWDEEHEQYVKDATWIKMMLQM